ncbi:P-loop containing nucleoside triphosphate hydrolase protein, partial [Apiospora phragmitis]
PSTPAGASPSGAWLLLSILAFHIAIKRRIMANVDMENGYNSSKPSGLRPPQTRLPQLSSSTSQGLHEISESQNNTRMGSSSNVTSGVKRGLPPPGTDSTPAADGFSPGRLSAYRSRLLTSIAFAVMQPEPKRKTLVEKASEFPGAGRSQIAAPTPARSFVKGSALKDIVSLHFPSFMFPQTQIARLPTTWQSNSDMRPAPWTSETTSRTFCSNNYDFGLHYPRPNSSIHIILFRLLLELLSLSCAICYLRIRQFVSRIWLSTTQEWRLILRLFLSCLFNPGDAFWPWSAPSQPTSSSGPPSTSLELSNQAIRRPRDRSGFRRNFFRIPNRIKSFHLFVSWLNKDDLGEKGVSLQLNANYSDHRSRLFQEDQHDVDWVDCLNWIGVSRSADDCVFNQAKPNTSTRPISYNSNTSRHASNSSYASSVGPGTRPPSRSSHTSYSHGRTGSVRSTTSRNARPVTSMGVRGEEQQTPNNNNGTKIPRQLAKAKSCSNLPISKKRKGVPAKGASISYTTPIPAAGEAFICEQMASLSMGKGGQVPQFLTRRINFTTPQRAVDPEEAQSALLGVKEGPVVPKTPTIEKFEQQTRSFESAYKSLRTARVAATHSQSPTKSPNFLNRYSNTTNFVAWDVDERLGTFESEFKAMKDIINHSIIGQKTLEEDVATFRLKATELETLKTDLESKKTEMQSELDKAERRIFMLERELEDEKRARRNDAEDLLREHRNDIDSRTRDFMREKDDLERDSRKRLQDLRDEMAADFARQLSEAHKVSEDLEKLLDEEKQNARLRVEESGKDLETQLVQFEVTKKELERAKVIQEDMNAQLLRKEARITDLENQVAAGQTALIHLKGDEQKQLENFRLMADEKQAALDEAIAAKREAQETKAKLRVEETRRRKLFEQLQTMKGNIRVMCRIRPGRNETECAQIATEVGDYDDCIGKMTLMVPTKNYLQQEVLEPKPYDFERVFIPDEGNKKVFDEISQLVQSALDGQKVCIFCYGQTGSGKTYTMSSGQDSIIPSATSMIYQATEDLKDAGWQYKMTGSFTEVYNEKLFDLLGSDGTRNQVELRQDPASKKFFVTSQETDLDSPDAVQTMLETAMKNRTVAATKMNRESSRSHSVFTLKLTGTNLDGTVSEGVLNLIDLAGSERVKESQVEGDNFKEATSINKSLSTLSQVMTALADNASHIPYRNSTLTRMLESCPRRQLQDADVSKAKPGQQGALKAIKTGRSGTVKKTVR